MAQLKRIGQSMGCSIYAVQDPSLLNRYFVLDHESSRRLMISPEVVGYDSYLATIPATSAALNFFVNECGACSVNILTILRGGLNYPLEECCWKAGIRVDNMSFLSCERIIEAGEIKGLDIKYDKMHICKDATLMIGDIVASGQTLDLCLNKVIERLHDMGGSLKRIVFFTIGGTKAFQLMEGLTRRIRSYWPEFEGFWTFFYEGIFSVYEDHGCTGVNIPDIDFGWKGGYIAPEFRSAVLDYPDALFEKCIIYDGGARRYEIPEHIAEVLEYWNALKAAAPAADMKEFVEEKIGYPVGCSYEQWLELTHLPEDSDTRKLYAKEAEFASRSILRSLEDICRTRIAEFTQTTANTYNYGYEKD